MFTAHSLRTAVVAAALAAAAPVGWQAVAAAQEPPTPTMERRHDGMDNAGMQRMHELMMEGNPGMARMHDKMMGAPGMAAMHNEMHTEDDASAP